MFEVPAIFDFDLATGHCAQKPTLVRKLSYMDKMFEDQVAFDAIADKEQLVYEFYDMEVPPTDNDLAFGCSVCYPGKVGNEYFMTKGHYHEVFATAETYFCLRGRGYMLMETPDGQWDAQELVPGRMVYVPGGWAHRSINVGSEPFVTFYVFRSDAGHDYATIESKGFRKLLVERNGQPSIVDNPKWQER